MINSTRFLTTKMKAISSSCLLIALSGCGSSGSISTQGTPVVDAEPIMHPQTVVISRTSIMPTNLGVSGSYSIKVDNHTGKNLTLKSFVISGSEKTNFLAKGYNALKSAVSGVGYDSRINVAICNTLVIDGSCAISFSPDEADGSTALKLNFIDEDGKSYSAAQLLEYSSSVNNQNGFYVSNTNITNVASTDSYSLSIPFVSADDYKSIEVDSAIVTLAKSVDCANGASKGTHCTVLLTLPAADPKSGGYSNQIRIKGTKADGSVHYALLASGTTYNDSAHLAITAGPVVISAANSLTKTIQIVNNGITDATGLSASSIVGSNWLAGISSSGGSSLLTKTINCGGASSLPNILPAASFCEVQFTLTNPNATGYEDYNITYSDGVDGSKSTRTSTKIYYRGNVTPSYAYILSGSVDFTNVQKDKSVSSALYVTNTGSNPLKDISYSNSPTLPAGITVDADASTCSIYTGATQLASGASCMYSLKYEPVAVTPDSLFNFKVIVHQPDTDAEVTPAQSLSIKYSALDSSGNGLIIVRNSKGYLIFADGKDTRTSRILIQNTGSTDFALSEITANDWSTNLSLIGPTDATSAGSGNPLSGVVSSDGIYNTAKTLPAGSISALDYTYGPTSLAEEGLAQQLIIGRFSGVNYNIVNLTGYKATSDGVVVVTPEDVTATGGSIDTSGNPAKNEFVLIKDNQAKVGFKYAAGPQDVSGFLVNDASLPFGFMVDSSATTCPTTSKTNVAGTILANTDCLVMYTYLASELNHSLFYTSATRARQEISAPPYSIKDATGIHVVTPDSKTGVNALQFVSVAATSTKAAVSGETIHEVTFTASGYANTLLPGAQVLVKPTFISGTSAKGSNTCTITNPEAGGNCSIEIVQTAAAPASITVPFNYSSTKDADFNSVDSSITLTR